MAPIIFLFVFLIVFKRMSGWATPFQLHILMFSLWVASMVSNVVATSYSNMQGQGRGDKTQPETVLER